MGVRLFDWSDLPALHHYRKDGVFLDSALLLTRGPLVGPGGIVLLLAPSMGIFTCYSRKRVNTGPQRDGPIHPPRQEARCLT